MAKPKMPKGAIVVVVAKYPRTKKVNELTGQLDDAAWETLCNSINRELLAKSFMPERNFFVIPDFDTKKKNAKESVHRCIRLLFKERTQHAGGCVIVVLSSFDEGSEVDRLLKRSFEIFLSLHGDGGNAFMLYTHQLENAYGSDE